ncbi:hypothetical protein C0J52_24806 [Blattella germanica]|nr:hypothetical protein C0J52_24806 [Blattella germanica]
MWTEQQKVQCVLWFAKLKSVTSVQRRIRREWNVDPPSRKSIYEWDRTLRDRGSLISKTGKHPKICKWTCVKEDPHSIPSVCVAEHL